MQALVQAALVVGLVVACHQPNPENPDAAGSVDASVVSGLYVPWTTLPTIPGDSSDNLTVATMLLRIDNLRVIGDAGPGDPRTSKSSFTVSWNGITAPATVAFMEAPTGLYSKLTLLADGHLVDDSYEITGTALINDVVYPYRIHDRDPINISLSTSATLEPGGEAHVPVRIAVQDALGVVDFTTLPSNGGTLELDTFDSQMPAFRAKLIESFSIGDQ